MTFHVGQKVVCVEDGPHCYFGPQEIEYPTKGGIYTIRAIRSSNYKRDMQCLLVEIVNPEFDTVNDGRGEPHFRHTRFRPIVERKTNISIFTKLLQPNSKIIERV